VVRYFTQSHDCGRRHELFLRVGGGQRPAPKKAKFITNYIFKHNKRKQQCPNAPFV
jgi:hypothetical protein